MTTLDTSSIASWDESFTLSNDRGNERDSIATEYHVAPDPEWEKCVDALLAVWQYPPTRDDGQVTAPSRDSISAAIQWLQVLRDLFPDAPPTLITCEPAGGIIVERRVRTDDGDLIAELTLYNDGTAENTLYRDGEVIVMSEIPFQPHMRA